MNHFTKSLVIVVISSLFLLAACNSKHSSEEMRNEIIETDKAFSEYSHKHGMKKAFYHYAAESAVMLRDDSYPIVGREKIKELFADRDDSLFTFTWEPSDADVAKSGELGYSYGTYKIQTKDTLLEGTYVSIWKKDRKGNWKYVLDSGNEGVGNH